MNHTQIAAPPVGLTELFKIGIGPSSSHTIGPMKAAGFFLRRLGESVPKIARMRATVFGSLAWTGKGHATDKAIVLGLAGEVPDSLDPDYAERRFAEIKASQSLTLPDGREIPFDPAHDIVFDYFQTFDRHPNAMRFEAFDDAGHTVSSEVWFSIGGGFAVGDGEADPGANAGAAVPYMYTSAEDLLRLGEESGLSIAEMALANEADRRPMDEHRPGDVCLHRSRIVHWRNASRQSARSAAGEGNLLAPSGRSRTRAQRAQ